MEEKDKSLNGVAPGKLEEIEIVAGQGLIENPTGAQVARFIIPSLIGVFLFLCPIIYNGELNIPLGVISEAVANFIKPFAPWLIFTIVMISAVLSLLTYIVKPKFILENKMLNSYFNTSLIYTVIRCLGAVIITMVNFQIGFSWIYTTDPDFATGMEMRTLMGTLVAWFFAASFLITLLMEYGIMDYTGTLIRNFLKPLFKLPGRAAIDLLASWIGNCNVGVVLTSKQYEEGYYTAREAVIISTCFSAVSLPFCLVIARVIGVAEYFVPMYLILTLTGVLSVIIMARIWPLAKKYPDEYYAPAGKKINEVEPTGIKKTTWAFRQAVTKAQDGPGIGQLLYRGVDTFLGIIFTLVPVTMCVGTIGLVLSNFTPVFDWISLPFGYYFQLLGVEEAFAAAPGAVVGFVDMFIPAIICGGIASVKTRFIICILSLVQIIYISEVGSTMLISKMPIKMQDLVIIFLEKTIISIPIIVLFTNIFEMLIGF